MNWALVVTLLYLAIVLSVGFAAARRSKGGTQEFFLAGRQLPWIFLLPLLAAEYISGGTTVGVAEKLHKTGIFGLTYYLASPFGLLMLAYGFAKFFQQIKKTTVGETIKLLFGEKTRFVVVLTLISLYPFTIMTSALALATVVGPVLGLPYLSAVWVCSAFIVCLAIMGLRGQAWMNSIHFATILVCFIPLGIGAVANVGGMNNLLSSLPPEHLNLFSEGFSKAAAWMGSAVMIKLIALSAITAMFAAKSEKDAKIGAIGTGVFLVVFVTLPALIGLAAYVVDPDLESKQALWMMCERLGGWATILASVGVMAAIISTTPASLLSLGTLATRDLFLLVKPNAEDKSQLLFCRLAIVVFAVVGTLIALNMTKSLTILDLGRKSTGIRTIITIPMLISILWRRIHPEAAFWSLLLGIGTGIIWLFLGSPLNLEPMWPGMAVGMVVLAITSLKYRPSPFKGAEGLDIATGKELKEA
ncbi:MAG: sodium:solute symporter family protein [Chloroflexota bacterium]